MQKLNYKCSMGKREKISSILSYLPIFVIIIIGCIYFQNEFIIPLLLLVALAIYPFLLTPHEIIITQEGITVKRLFRSKYISMQDIVAVAEREPKEFRNDFRNMGVSGMLGHFGRFKSNTLGNYYAIVNNSENIFWVISKQKIYLLSCDNNKETLKEITKYIKK